MFVGISGYCPFQIYFYHKMRKQQTEVLEDISSIQKNQGLLLQKAKNVQQQIFQLFAHRNLISHKMLHKHIEQVIDYLPGSFANSALNAAYLAVCLEMRLQLNPEDHPLLKRLVDWSDNYPFLLQQPKISLVQAVLPENNIQGFESYESYLTFLNFIGGDLVKLIRRSKEEEQKIEQNNLRSVNAEDLINFLWNSLPKILYNIILPNDVLPPEQKRNNQSMQILYRAPSCEYFVRAKPYYASLIKILVKILVKLELRQVQQKQMMEIVFRYFYAYHHDKKYGATDIFIEAYNSLGQSVRFAMADEFVLFCKVIRKVGKGKFVEFLLSKSAWLKDINARVADNNYVGYAKESLNPFSSLRVPENIIVPNGKTQYRTFEILQDYSIFYFNIQIQSKDITLKLHYLGEFNDSKPSKTELLSYEKRSGNIKANIMAARRGIYQFEFDNTYSWINSKTIKFEQIILAPVEFQDSNPLKWLKSYYDNIVLNEVSDKAKLIIVKRALPPKSDIEYDGVANITKAGSFYNIKVGKGSNMYEFQTESEDRLVKKFSELVEKSGTVKWMVGGQPLIESGDLKSILGKGISAVKGERKQQASESLAAEKTLEKSVSTKRAESQSSSKQASKEEQISVSQAQSQGSKTVQPQTQTKAQAEK